MLEHLLSDAFRERRESLRARWYELLRFPSIASEPVHAPACARCAAWLRDELADIGFDATVEETPGQPLVIAERAADVAGSPTVLFYGHYDVQPADPLGLWRQPDPFEPVERDGRVYARGAQDDKGQFFFPLQALRTLATAGVPLPHLRIVLEGEEECGSHGIATYLAANPRRFAADVLVVCDTGMAPDGRPALVAGLRGIVQATVALEGADHDLHSGQHGGVAPNAALGLARLLATLHDTDGHIRVEGFLDGLREPDEAEREAALALPFDAEAYRAETGAEPTGGERGVPPQLRLGFRPTIEINGLHGGYGGPGQKTIIPARAEAKLSARICPGQDPDACLAAIERHLRRHCPAGLRLTFDGRPGGLPGFRLPIDAPAAKVARSILDTLDPRGSVLLWEGASIPIVSALRDASGAEVLLAGFGLEADRIHAPNESYSWAQAELSFRFAGLLFARLARRI